MSERRALDAQDRAAEEARQAMLRTNYQNEFGDLTGAGSGGGARTIARVNTSPSLSDDLARSDAASRRLDDLRERRGLLPGTTSPDSPLDQTTNLNEQILRNAGYDPAMAPGEHPLVTMLRQHALRQHIQRQRAGFRWHGQFRQFGTRAARVRPPRPVSAVLPHQDPIVGNDPYINPVDQVVLTHDPITVNDPFLDANNQTLGTQQQTYYNTPPPPTLPRGPVTTPLVDDSTSQLRGGGGGTPTMLAQAYAALNRPPAPTAQPAPVARPNPLVGLQKGLTPAFVSMLADRRTMAQSNLYPNMFKRGSSGS